MADSVSAKHLIKKRLSGRFFLPQSDMGLRQAKEDGNADSYV
jgi:hypothetical protein